MHRDVFRYDFEPEVELEEIEAALVLAIWSCEALHGESPVRLNAAHFLNATDRCCVIDANTPVGRDINKLFVGFLRKEIGDDGFQVKFVSPSPVAERNGIADS